MPWLVMDHYEPFIALLFFVLVGPSLVGAIAGTWIMWGKDRSLLLGFLMGFTIASAGSAFGWLAVVMVDHLAPLFVGLALAVVVLFAIAKYLPDGEPDTFPRPTAPPKPDRSNLHQ